jgi:hypothetical protein
VRRDHGPARVAVAAGGATLLVAASVAVPSGSGAPRPTIADLAVVAGLGVAVVWLAAVGHQRTAGLLAAAAVVWTTTGLATSLPEGMAAPVSRLVLVPHALVVVALAVGQVRARRVVVPAVAAGTAAVAAGSGLSVPVLVLLGVAVLMVLVLGRPSAAPGVRAATGALGLALAAADPHVLGNTLDPHDLAVGVDVLLLGVTAVATRQLTADRLHRLAVPAADRGRDEVGTWLAGVLGAPRLYVAFPSGRGAIDAAGHPAEYPGDEAQVRDDRDVVAYVSPAVNLEQTVREPLVAMLRRLGEVARLRAECREQATEIVASRGRLQAAADEESRRLERQLDRTLLARLDRIDALLRTSSGSGLTERVQDVRAELLRHARGLDPLAGRSLAGALAAHRARGVGVDVGDLGDVDPACARTAWYVATEGITNAVKHAAGSGVRLEVGRHDRTLRVVVMDRGPGGADPDGAGLQGLADRVAAAGGTLRVTSGPDGTTVSCTLPCQGNPATPSRGIADPMTAGRS